MDYTRIITIAGAVGSGKSSTAKRVAEILGFKHFSSGDLFRAMARERGLSVEAINLTAEEQSDIDHEVDELLQKMGKEEERLVIDSRLAWHWMPQSFKVYLALDPEIAAARIFNHMQTEGRVSESASSVEEVLQSIEVRVASEKKRYHALYGIDVSDTSPFDLVINTADYNLDGVVERVLEAYKAAHE